MKRLLKLIDKHLSYISLALAAPPILILGYYLGRAYAGIDPFYPVGTNMVDKEIIIIPGYLYMKPVTLMVLLAYASYVTGLQALTRHAIENWGRPLIQLIEAAALFFAYLSGYEVLFNFTLWSALISSITVDGTPVGNIDLLYNPFPNPETPWNIVFATKIFTLIFAMSLTTVYFTRKWRTIQMTRQQTVEA